MPIMNYQQKSIPGFPSYWIDISGNLAHDFHYVDGRIQKRKNKIYLDNSGRPSVTLGGMTKHVSRLLAETFIPNPENKPCVCHKNGDPSDNRIENLYWGTAKENMLDKLKHGTHIQGEKVWNAKLNKYKIERIKFMKEIMGRKLTNRKIAKIFGVNPSQISRLLSGKRWKHLSFNKTLLFQ